MTRVRTSPLSIPIPTGGARQALGLSGDISRATTAIVTALDRFRQTVNRRKVITAETKWLSFLANAQDEVAELDPDDRLTSFQAQAKEFGKTFSNVKDGALRQEMQLGFARDAARTEIRVQRDARKAEVSVSNAALEELGGELRAKALRGENTLQESMDRYSERVDWLINHSHTALEATQKKRAFAIQMVRTQFGRIKTSGELTAIAKHKMIGDLLDSDLAAENMDAGEMANKRDESVNILVQETHRLVNIASSAVILPNGGEMLDTIEDQVRNMPDVIGTLKSVALADIAAFGIRRAAIDVDAQTITHQFALDKPLTGQWSPTTLNAAYETIQDDTHASMADIGAWFARGTTGFPDNFRKDYRNLWDADSRSFDLAMAMETYRAISAQPGGKDRVDQMLAETDMSDVAQTTVRMIAMDELLAPQVLEMMSSPDAKATLNRVASDLQDPLMIDGDQWRDDIDNSFEGLGDVMVNREALADWRAGVMFNMLARQAAGAIDPLERKDAYTGASKFAVENLKGRWKALDFDIGNWDFVLVPKFVDASPAMTAFLNDHVSGDETLYSLIITVDADKNQLLPFTEDGQITGIASWNPDTGEGQMLRPDSKGWNAAIRTVLPGSRAIERDQWHPYMRQSSHQGGYIEQADPTLARKLYGQAKAYLESIGTLSDDDAVASEQVSRMAEVVAKTRGWFGLIQPEPAGDAATQ